MDQEAYDRVRLIFEATAAKVNGVPCTAYLGPGAAGHFVKMVHNGIEYGVMQLIAETYDLMKRGLDLNDDELHAVFGAWAKSELGGYLLEISGHIFAQPDEKTGKRLIDVILDEASQNGTGRWTSQSAMDLQVPVPTIDLAVAMRDMSMLTKVREQASHLYPRQIPRFAGDRDTYITQLRGALYTATLAVYAQGFALLTVASEKYNYRLNLESVAGIWRGGCIIRAALLDDVCAAFHLRPDLPNLLLDLNMASKLIEYEDCLRQIVRQAAELGVPAPGLMVSLGYIDAFRSAWLPANLIQAQRDYFGAHSYERIDAKGAFHTSWEQRHEP
jgi:6-phosphogluconate dehydrogenase